MAGSVPTRDEVEAHMIQLISEIGKIPREKIANTATVEEELRMESVQFVELQVAIEDTYGVEIDPIQIVELNEFRAIVDYVYQSVAAGCR
jgi:acyl carrier protein